MNNNDGASGANTVILTLILVLVAVGLVIFFFRGMVPAEQPADNDAGINLEVDIPDGDQNNNQEGTSAQ